MKEKVIEILKGLDIPELKIMEDLCDQQLKLVYPPNYRTERDTGVYGRLP